MSVQMYSPVIAPRTAHFAESLALRRAAQVRQDKTLILLFLFTATATVLISAVLVVNHFTTYRLPSVGTLVEEVERSLGYTGRSREQFLSQMSALDRRRFEQDVRFVAELVEERRSSRVRESDVRTIAEAIVRVSYEHNYDPLLVTAVIEAESTFNRFAQSHKGAVGLMQLLPSTGKYISGKASRSWDGSGRLTEADYNIRLGVAYLQYLEKMFRGDRELALVAYNWGPGKVLEVNRNRAMIPSGPRSYAKKIMKNHKAWSNSYNQIARRSESQPSMLS